MADQNSDKKTADEAEKAYAAAAAEAKSEAAVTAPVKAPDAPVSAKSVTKPPVLDKTEPEKSPVGKAPAAKAAPEVKPAPAQETSSKDVVSASAPASSASAKSQEVAKPQTVAKPRKAAARPAPAKVPAPKPVAAKSAKTVTKAKAPGKAASGKVAAPMPSLETSVAKPTLTPKTAPISELKEKIMATAKTTTPDYSNLVKDMKVKAEDALAKSTELASEVTELAKGNVEALVESSKILASGTQEIGKEYVAETKSAFEAMTADLKEMAAVKSPTELFQLQGKFARRNFDQAMAFSSKNSETFLKLANAAFAPISNRMSLAVDKFSKIA